MNATNSPQNATPFIIEHRRNQQSAAAFTPETALLLTPALRTSGLLEQMSDRAARPLLTLLSFLSPNGNITPSIHEIAQALGISAGSVRDFMEPLTQLHWQGAPLAIPLLRESGMDGYMLSPKAAVHVHKVVMDAHLEATGGQEPEVLDYTPAGREAIIAASRAKYARPRAEVEREIEEALGHDPREADQTPEGETRRRLYSLGVPREEIETLLTEHSAQEALQQLDWLPLRGAKSPGRFVMAAIRGNYEAPAIVPEAAVTVSTSASPISEPPREPEKGDSGELLEGPLPLPDDFPEPDSFPQEPEPLPQDLES